MFLYIVETSLTDLGFFSGGASSGINSGSRRSGGMEVAVAVADLKTIV